MRGYCLQFIAWDNDKVLEMDSGDGYTTCEGA